MSEPEEAEAAPAANPVDWIVLADAVGKNDPIPEWPTILNLIPKRCNRCILAFVSPVNHLRHVITHDEDTKMLSEADKESFEEYLKTLNLKTALSFERVKLKVDGFELSILKELKSYNKKQKIVFPGAYIKAGEMLLVAVQAYQKRGPCPVTVKQLFEILHDASEETSFCYRIDDSVQAFVFQDYGKMPDNNIVACAAFLLERKLVDDWSHFKKAEALCNEEDNQKESQAKPIDNNKKKKGKNKEKKSLKQVVDPEPKEIKECGDDASKFPTETSIHRSDPSGEDCHDQVAQPDQLPKADLPSDGEKGDNEGSGQEQNEKILLDDVSSERQQKDADLEPIEHEVEEQPTRQSKSKVHNRKRAERKARKKNDQEKKKKMSLQNKSYKMPFTGSPRSDVTQISDAEEEEDRKCVQKEETSEQQNQDEKDTSGGTSDVPATMSKNDDSSVASLADDPDNIKRVKEDFKQVWQIMLLRLQNLQSRNPPRYSDRGESHQKCIQYQFQDATDTSDSLQSGETGCFGAASESSKENKIIPGDNLPGDKEEDGELKQKSGVGLVLTTDTTEEQKNEDKDVKDVKHGSDLLHSGGTPSGSALSESRTEAHITQPDQSDSLSKPVALPVSPKFADAEGSQERPETKELHCQSEYKKEKNAGPATKKPSKDEFRCPIAATTEGHSKAENKEETSDVSATVSKNDDSPVASLADDPDSIRRVKEDFERVWQMMLLSLQNLQSRNPPRE